MDAGPSRVRPTASARRHRTRLVHTEDLDAPSPPAEAVHEDMPARDEEDEAVGPCPGGPEDESVLISFRTHIAASIWREQERAPLKCLNHAAKVAEWQWWTSEQSNRRFRALVEQSGLVGLVHCSYRYTDKILVSGFVERWQPETNTFHLPFGEMTVTLDDVAAILGITVTGAAVSLTCDRMGDRDAEELLVELLGVTQVDARQEILSARGQSVRLEWLKSHCHAVSDRDSHHRIECAARGYLLFLLGCTLFVDKTGTRVPVAYLSLLRELDRVSTYAWGAAALAYLYRQLGVASRASVRQIGGYMTLLQAWIYEHFPALSPHPSLDYTDDIPRVHRWSPGTSSRTTMDHLVILRESLDVLSTDEVVWDPHRRMREEHPYLDIAFFSGCLKCMDVVEPYHPERVLRQFGRIQTIPRAPLAPTRASRGSTAASYRIIYVFLDQMWERWEDHLLRRASRSHPVIQPSDCVPGYMDWYARITHLAVQPPDRRSSTYSRARGDVASMHRRIADAITIGAGIVQMGRDEVASLGTGHLYDTISHMTRVLQGQHISSDEADEPGPSHALAPSGSQQYRRRRRRDGD